MPKYQYIRLCSACDRSCDYAVERRVKLRGIFFIHRMRICCLRRYRACNKQRVSQEVKQRHE